MPLAFAAIESRVNRAVIGRLANREALYTPMGGGEARTLAGIFDAEYAVRLEELAGDSSPAFTCSADDIGDVRRGAGLVIDGEQYEVVEPKPDGAGLTVLRLRSA